MLYEHKIKNGAIHIHCEWSVKDSAMSIATMLKRADELGAPAVTLTDHGTLSGIFPLFNTAKKLKSEGKIGDIKVIPGVEAYVEGDGVITRNMHLILLPCDYIGYKAISKAVTKSNNNIDSTSGAPRMTVDDLCEFFGEQTEAHGHVIACSACVAGVLSQVLLQNKRIEKEMSSLKKKLSSATSPKNPDNIAALARLEKIDEKIAELTSEKKEHQATLKKSLSRLEKTVKALEGKEGYSVALEELNEERKKKVEATKRLESISYELTHLSAEKKPLAAIRTKVKGSAETFAKYEAKYQSLKNSIKDEFVLLKETEEQALNYQKIFGKGNFYIELQYHGATGEKDVMPKLAFVANKLDIPTVATNDAHFARNSPDDELARRINMSQRFNIWQEKQPGDDQLYIKADDELADALKTILSDEIVDKAMLGIKNIIDRCNVEMPKETHYPKYPLPEGTTAGEYLRKLAEDGIPQRYSNSEWTKAHRERLEYELKIIHEMGFDDYHLIVQDFLNYAREKAKDPKTGIGVGVGPGRGSAVGSLVCYLIGITDVDPIKHDLLFERYLNPERVTMPDIDSDFAKFVRPSAFEYVKNLFGERNVCIIETDARQPPKAAIKAVGRVYGDKDYNEAAEKMASFITMKDNKSFSTVDNGKTLKERLLEKFTDAVSVDIINMAELIEGSLINYGTHAAGVVIADNGDISEYVPLKRNKDGDKWACQCSKEEVEGNAGLLKFDFLGLINLDIENNCLREIYKNHGRKINLSKIPFEKEVFRSIFATGRTNAVFQFESAGMKQMLKEFKPDCIEDIILLVAAYRPGPMQYLPEIKAVKSGEKKAEYIFPKLSEVLSSTYGKPVYQEQIQAIFHRFAGCSLGEADIVRRAMSKKKIDILTDPKTNYKGRFIDGMIANGSTAENAEKFWIELLEFANYAFNKSHAAAYAYLAYQTAWLKYHYPAEYLASVLKYAKIERYPMLINEAHNFNIAVLPPSIRYSEEEFTAVKGMINFGIGNIKGIGNSGGIIIEERNKYPFSSFKDFLKRVPFKQNQLEALIDAGVFDEFNKNRLALNSGSETVCDIIKHINQKKTQLTSHLKAKEKEEITPKELKTLENKILNVETAIEEYEKELESYMFGEVLEDLNKKLERENDILGYYVSGHPMDNWEKPDNVIDIAELDEGKDIAIAGIVKNLTILHRKSDNAPFAKFNLEDKSGSIPVMCWTAYFTPNNQNLLQDGAAVRIFGKCSIDKEDDEGNKLYIFSLVEVAELKQNVSFETLAERKIGSYFDKKLSVVISSLAEWLRVKDKFKEYRDDTDGCVVNVRIKGYRKAKLGYKVSSDIIYSDLGVSVSVV